jgi:hypothetical protein
MTKRLNKAVEQLALVIANSVTKCDGGRIKAHRNIDKELVKMDLWANLFRGRASRGFLLVRLSPGERKKIYEVYPDGWTHAGFECGRHASTNPKSSAVYTTDRLPKIMFVLFGITLDLPRLRVRSNPFLWIPSECGSCPRTCRAEVNRSITVKETKGRDRSFLR